MGNFCRKCKKRLEGLTVVYDKHWICSDCVEDKTDVLYCEKGCKVKAINLDNGMAYDAEKAHKYLEQDKEYTVNTVSVGGWSSTIQLQEIPGVNFNTVHFIRVK